MEEQRQNQWSEFFSSSFILAEAFAFFGFDFSFFFLAHSLWMSCVTRSRLALSHSQPHLFSPGLPSLKALLSHLGLGNFPQRASLGFVVDKPPRWSWVLRKCCGSSRLSKPSQVYPPVFVCRGREEGELLGYREANVCSCMSIPVRCSVFTYLKKGEMTVKATWNPQKDHDRDTTIRFCISQILPLLKKMLLIRKKNVFFLWFIQASALVPLLLKVLCAEFHCRHD